MNKDIMKAAGFDQEVSLVEAGACPICKNPINNEDFTDDDSRAEYTVSGMCQACQDRIFN